LIWIGYGGAASMLIGAFGPWATVRGLVNTSIAGTDGSGDGWLVVGAALVGAGALFLYTERGRIWAVGTLLAGAAATYVTYHDRSNVSEVVNENASDLASFSVGWGLNLALGASFAVGVVGAVAVFGNQDAPGMRPEVLPETARRSAQSEPEPSPVMTALGDIEHLAELHRRGVLTDDEFRMAKQRTLRSTDSSDLQSG
jgi:hypothetical protein